MENKVKNRDISDALREYFYKSYIDKVFFSQQRLSRESVTSEKNIGIKYLANMTLDSAMFLEDYANWGKSDIESEKKLKEDLISTYYGIISFVDNALCCKRLPDGCNDSYDVAILLGREVYKRTRGSILKNNNIQIKSSRLR